MVKIIMHGCNGHMGQVISGIVEKDPDAEIVAGIDIADQGKNSYPVFTDIDTCQVEADAIIDFSSAKATDTLLEHRLKRGAACKSRRDIQKSSSAEIRKHVSWHQHTSETGSGCCQGSCNCRI